MQCAFCLEASTELLSSSQDNLQLPRFPKKVGNCMLPRQKPTLLTLGLQGDLRESQADRAGTPRHCPSQEPAALCSELKGCTPREVPAQRPATSLWSACRRRVGGTWRRPRPRGDVRARGAGLAACGLESERGRAVGGSRRRLRRSGARLASRYGYCRPSRIVSLGSLARLGILTVASCGDSPRPRGPR